MYIYVCVCICPHTHGCAIMRFYLYHDVSKVYIDPGCQRETITVNREACLHRRPPEQGKHAPSSRVEPRVTDHTHTRTSRRSFMSAAKELHRYRSPRCGRGLYSVRAEELRPPLSLGFKDGKNVPVGSDGLAFESLKPWLLSRKENS